MSDRRPPSPEARKKLIKLMFSFAVTLTVYLVLLKTEMFFIIDLVYIVASLLFVVYFYLSAAMAKTLPEKEDLNPAWSEDRRERFAKKLKINQERSKKLIYIMVPLLAVVAFDMLRKVFQDLL